MKTLALSLIGCLCAMSATAATTGYTSKTAFLSGAGVTTDHTTASHSFTASRAYSNGLTVNEAGGTFVSATSFGVSERGVPGALLINDLEHLDFNFAQHRFGFGLNIFEATTTDGNGCGVPAGCVESTFTFTFKNGTTVVGSETFSPANESVTFFGVTSDLGFNRVEMRETTGTNDNERFGGFVSAAAPAPVPLPASALLLLASVGGLTAMRRKA